MQIVEVKSFCFCAYGFKLFESLNSSPVTDANVEREPAQASRHIIDMAWLFCSFIPWGGKGYFFQMISTCLGGA
jgi:hypothetical protein